MFTTFMTMAWAISNGPSTHKLGPTSVGVMTWSGSDRIFMQCECEWSCFPQQHALHERNGCNQVRSGVSQKIWYFQSEFRHKMCWWRFALENWISTRRIKKKHPYTPTRHQFYMPNHNRKFTMELVNSIPRRPKRWSSCPCSVALSPSSKDEITEITLGGFCHVSKSSAILMSLRSLQRWYFKAVEQLS